MFHKFYFLFLVLCGDYTEESDKCANIVEQTPKKLATQKRYNSLLPSFITILDSVWNYLNFNKFFNYENKKILKQSKLKLNK